jgi:L-fuconolactonase
MAVGGISLQPWTSLARFQTARDALPIVDTHLHLWDLEAMDYPWLQGENNALGRNFLIPDFKEATAGMPISKMVFVECARLPEQYLQEVAWVEKQALIDPRIKGMVAYFPLEKGSAAKPEFEELTERKIVRGIRKSLMADHPKFINGVEMMSQSDLSYDLNVNTSQMDAALKLVQQFPNQTFILNHMGNPDIKGKDWKLWDKKMKSFSTLENVNCKISGMITKANPQSWAIEDLLPYFNTVISTFGPDRILYGGDWPVVLRAGSYGEWMAAFIQLASTLSENEKKKLYYLNAERIYRI